MARLTKPTEYKIEDSNIALLGSDLEKRVREHAGDSEEAWVGAGTAPGTQIWRIEQFHVKPWSRFGEFFNGDSYIILHTYKKDPNSDALSYSLHFWLGEETTQDEAGTAAYKTVELDDHLHGAPVEYREVQGSESSRFLSYFDRFLVLQGGTESGFRHVTDPPPLELFNLYHVAAFPASRVQKTASPAKTTLIVRQITHDYHAVVAQYPEDVFVLDKGTQILQYNTKLSAGKERFKAAEFVRGLINERKGEPELKVLDEGGSGASTFLLELGEDLKTADEAGVKIDLDEPSLDPKIKLFRISEVDGTVNFSAVETDQPTLQDLAREDSFLVDASTDPYTPAVYAWIGSNASERERKYAIQIGQDYLWGLAKQKRSLAKIPIVRVREGSEPQELLDILGV